jgi:D-amino-acid oxidase
MKPTRNQITVIGCGVIGLSTAIRLREHGFPVRIVAHQLPPETTSNVAGALWYPYRAYPYERVHAWAVTTLRELETLARNGTPGLEQRELREYFVARTADPWWRAALSDFRRLEAAEIPPAYADGYTFRTVAIDTDLFLGSLVSRFQSIGGTIERLEHPLSSLDEARRGSSLLVNCSGLGARQLCDDTELFPIRGEVVHLDNPGVRSVSIDEEGFGEVAYVIPHEKHCVIGSTAVDHSWDTTPDPAAADRIEERCSRLEPSIEGAPRLGVRVGLRPGRSAVRLELDAGRDLIHCYGHGGAGFSLSWGCAAEVTALAARHLS